MAAKFHVMPIKTQPELWAVLLNDVNGNWFMWPRHRGGEFFDPIFSSQIEARMFAEREAANWNAIVVG